MQRKTKKNFGTACPEKKTLRFHTEFCEFRDYQILNIVFFWLGQEVIHIEVNLVWSIPRVYII